MSEKTNSNPKTEVALVSGASRGLGFAIVNALLEGGHKVAAFSRTPSKALMDLKQRYPNRLYYQSADVADSDSLRGLVDSVQERLGDLTVLVNNAGILHEAVFARQDVSAISNLIDVNLRGTLLLTRQALRGMMIRQGGSIINISSIVSVSGYKGTVAYSATKGGIDAMTRALAREVGSRNITVNSIAPGYLKTDLTATMSEKHLNQIVRRTPMGRLGVVEDVVGLVLFLISPAARFITAQTIVVDGGLTA